MLVAVISSPPQGDARHGTKLPPGHGAGNVLYRIKRNKSSPRRPGRPWHSPGPTANAKSVGPAEQSHQPRGALGVALQLRQQLLARQAGRQLLGIEVGGDQREGVV